MIEIFLALISLGSAVWALYSVVGIIFPLRPFRSRKAAAKSLGMTVVLFSLVVLAFGVYGPQQKRAAGSPVQTEEPAPSVQADVELSALQASLDPDAVIPEACGEGGLIPGDVVAVTGDHDLRIGPNKAAQRIKNEKASLALGEEHFQQIDASTTVRRLCAQSDWTEVQIVTPDWLTDVTGWVPNEALREIERTADGDRVFVEADFFWDDDTSQFKPQIIAVVNKIASENRHCSNIDTASVSKSSSRSKPRDPVFFVTCGEGAAVFNVWFRPADADAAQTFGATEPLGQNAAVGACETAAKLAATHPSTVEFSRVWDLAYMSHVSGRARVVSSFTARNNLNLQLKYRIDCLFDGPNLVEAQITESLD